MLQVSHEKNLYRFYISFWICFCKSFIYWTPTNVDGNSTYGGPGESNPLLFTCFSFSFKYAGMCALYWCFINFMTISRASSRLLNNKTLFSLPPSFRDEGRITLFSFLKQKIWLSNGSWEVSGRDKRRRRASLGQSGGKGLWGVNGSRHAFLSSFSSLLLHSSSAVALLPSETSWYCYIWKKLIGNLSNLTQ